VNPITQADIDILLETAPTGDAKGEVEVQRYTDRNGRHVYVVNQFSHDGGWSSPYTSSLLAANIAAEALAIRINAVLLACVECDAEEGDQ
jgi:hypothetical protein